MCFEWDASPPLSLSVVVVTCLAHRVSIPTVIFVGVECFLKIYHNILHFGDVEDLTWHVVDLLPDVSVEVHGIGLNCAQYKGSELGCQYSVDSSESVTSEDFCWFFDRYIYGLIALEI